MGEDNIFSFDPFLHGVLVSEDQVWRRTDFDASDNTQTNVHSVLLRKGLTIKYIHKYFSNFNPQRCCLRLTSGQSSYSALRVVKNGATESHYQQIRPAPNLSTNITKLSDNDLCLFRKSLLCAQLPILSAPDPPSTPVPAQTITPTPSPHASHGFVYPPRAGSVASSQMDDNSTLSLEGAAVIPVEMLCEYVAKVFHLRRESAIRYEKQIHESLQRKAKDKILYEELSSQLLQVEENKHPFYEQNCFVWNAQGYAVWRSQRRASLGERIGKVMGTGSSITPGKKRSEQGDHHSDYTHLCHKLMRFEHDQLETGSSHLYFPLSSVSLRLLQEYRLRFGVGLLYCELTLLQYLSEHWDPEIWYINAVSTQINKVHQLLPSNRAASVITQHEVSMLATSLHILFRQCENALSRINRLFHHSSPTEGVGALIGVLEQVLHLKCYIGAPADNNMTELLKKWTKAEASLSYRSIMMKSSQALHMEPHNDQPTPALLNKVRMAIREEVQQYWSSFIPVYQRFYDVCGVVAKEYYGLLMEDVKLLTDLQALKRESKEKSGKDLMMLSLAFRLNELDEEWSKYVEPEAQIWRPDFLAECCHLLSSIGNDATYLLKQLIKADTFECIHVAASAFIEEHSSTRSSSTVSQSSLTPSHTSAFTPVHHNYTTNGNQPSNHSEELNHDPANQNESYNDTLNDSSEANKGFTMANRKELKKQSSNGKDKESFISYATEPQTLRRSASSPNFLSRQHLDFGVPNLVVGSLDALLNRHEERQEFEDVDDELFWGFSAASVTAESGNGKRTDGVSEGDKCGALNNTEQEINGLSIGTNTEVAITEFVHEEGIVEPVTKEGTVEPVTKEGTVEPVTKEDAAVHVTEEDTAETGTAEQTVRIPTEKDTVGHVMEQDTAGSDTEKDNKKSVSKDDADTGKGTEIVTEKDIEDHVSKESTDAVFTKENTVGHAIGDTAQVVTEDVKSEDSASSIQHCSIDPKVDDSTKSTVAPPQDLSEESRNLTPTVVILANDNIDDSDISGEDEDTPNASPYPNMTVCDSSWHSASLEFQANFHSSATHVPTQNGEEITQTKQEVRQRENVQPGTSAKASVNQKDKSHALRNENDVKRGSLGRDSNRRTPDLRRTVLEASLPSENKRLMLSGSLMDLISLLQRVQSLVQNLCLKLYPFQTNGSHPVGGSHVMSFETASGHVTSGGHVTNGGHVTSSGHVTNFGHETGSGHVTTSGHVTSGGQLTYRTHEDEIEDYSAPSMLELYALSRRKLYQLAVKEICGLCIEYADNLLCLDLCGLMEGMANTLVGKELIKHADTQFAKGVIWGCRHMMTGQKSCDHYLNGKKNKFLADNHEPVTQQMCIRVNLLVELLTVRRHVLANLKTAVDIHTITRLTGHRSHTDVSSSPMCGDGDADDISVQEGEDHIQAVLKAMLNVLAYRVSIFAKDALHFLLVVDLPGISIEMRLAPLTEFLQNHMKMMKQWLLPQNFPRVMRKLWLCIVQVMEDEITGLQYMDTSVQDRVELLMQTLQVLMRLFSRRDVACASPTFLTRVSHNAVLWLTLYLLPTQHLTVLSARLQEQYDRGSLMESSTISTDTIPDMEYLHNMKVHLHRYRKCFKAHHLVDYVCTNPPDSCPDVDFTAYAYKLGQRLLDNSTLCNLDRDLESEQGSSRSSYPPVEVHSESFQFYQDENSEEEIDTYGGDSTDSQYKREETYSTDSKYKREETYSTDSKYKREETYSTDSKYKREETYSTDSKYKREETYSTDSKYKREETYSTDSKYKREETYSTDSKYKREETYSRDSKYKREEIDTYSTDSKDSQHKREEMDTYSTDSSKIKRKSHPKNSRSYASLQNGRAVPNGAPPTTPSGSLPITLTFQEIARQQSRLALSSSVSSVTSGMFVEDSEHFYCFTSIIDGTLVLRSTAARGLLRHDGLQELFDDCMETRVPVALVDMIVEGRILEEPQLMEDAEWNMFAIT